MLVLVLVGNKCFAQINYFQSSLFANQFLFNPSKAGAEKIFAINAHVKSSLDNSQPGLPKEYAFSVDMPIAEKAGAGLIIVKQLAGLMETSLVNFNYSYGIQFGKSMKLRLGLAGGIKNAKLSIAQIQGDQNDPVALEYNSHPPSFASSFGISLTTKKLELETVLPNLTASIQNPNLKTIDYEIARAGIGLNIPIKSQDLVSKSLKIIGGVIYYKVTGIIVLGGICWNTGSSISLNGQYNSTGVITGGIGINVNEKIKINLNCSMGGLYAKSIYGGTGIAELHLNYNIKKKNNE